MKRQPAAAPPEPPRPRPRSLAALVALALVVALVSVFLWLQLVLARSGGPTVCGLGGEGDCASLWDGRLASAVHDTTGLPLPAWGLVWALVAFTIPLLELVALSERRVVPGLVSAVRFSAGAGAAAEALSTARARSSGALRGRGVRWPG